MQNRIYCTTRIPACKLPRKKHKSYFLSKIVSTIYNRMQDTPELKTNFNRSSSSKVCNSIELIILLPPWIHKKEHPRNSQYDISNNLPQTIVGKIIQLSFNVDPPNGYRNMKQNAPLGKEALKLLILNKRNHKQKAPDGKQQQPRKWLRDLDQELVVRCRTLKLGCNLNAVAKDINILGVKHHQSSTR